MHSESGAHEVKAISRQKSTELSEALRSSKSSSTTSLQAKSLTSHEPRTMPHGVSHGKDRNDADRIPLRADGAVTSDIATLDAASQLLNNQMASVGSNATYQDARQALLADERQRRWDEPARQRASAAEIRAQEIIFTIREHERRALFGDLPSEAIPGPETRDMGGHFLRNKQKIQQSRIFAMAQELPKGSHLHLHFNSEIQPELLLPHARNLTSTFYIRSTIPLINDEDFANAEIVFNVLPADTKHADIFTPSYNPDWKPPGNAQGPSWMLWEEFRSRFPSHVEVPSTSEDNIDHDLDLPERWARAKMVVDPNTAYDATNTHNGAWACFNIGTRAFKGLVGYEGIYRWYIGQAIESMMKDKVMYAELRPMLLDKTIPSDDGLRQLDHNAQMNIICEEIEKARLELKHQGRLHEFPFGIKIIYSTPRSIPRPMMQKELNDCIRLKLQHPDLICGFDLVGAEDRPNSISVYADLLVAFTKTCTELNIKIPFMFHAGETLLDTGGSANPENSNLYDAVLLEAERIGHGYALLKHPLLIERYKEKNICLELCPISNELLHLCGNAREHPFPALLAAGLHCTLNADNPSLFRGSSKHSSSLSHEFYQVMVGDTRMTVHGWKQLAEWSIEHSCINPEEKEMAMTIYRDAFEKFCKWVVATHGDYADSLEYPK
nr:adenosine deaminase cecr1 [Quercus suber]